MSKALNIIWGVIMFVVLFATFVMVKPESQIALIYEKFKSILDGLILIKIAILLGITFVVIKLVSKNLNKWSEEFRLYNLNQANKAGFTFFAKGYERPWMKYHSKGMIIFGSLMVVIGVYVVLFSPANISSLESNVLIATTSPQTEEVTTATSSVIVSSSTQTSLKPSAEKKTLEKKAPLSAWKTYSYSGYSIQFPAEPTLIDESTPGREFKTYVAPQEDGTAYFITEMDIPQSLVGDSDRQTLMNAASIVINQTKQSAEVTIDYAVDTTNEIGYPSIEFSLSISEGPRKLFGQYILLGNKMYQMRVVTTIKSEKNAEFRKFFASFVAK